LEHAFLTIANVIFIFIIYKYIEYRSKKQHEQLIKQLDSSNLKKFEAWKISFQKDTIPKIKKETLARSRNTIRGLATEHLAPIMQNKYNPKDFRHLGNPIDFIVFEGLSDVIDKKTNEITSIILLDVKTGNSKLNKSQRKIRDALNAGKIKFEIYNPDKNLEP
jgi:predicted Holliday junction resolvase-like endonuclease